MPEPKIGYKHTTAGCGGFLSFNGDSSISDLAFKLAGVILG